MNNQKLFLSEYAIIEFLQKQNKTLSKGDIGIGDDAAVVDIPEGKLVVTTDSLVENVHFKTSWVTPEFLGRKAALTNISDISAMGATPLYALISLIFPKIYFSESFIRSLYKGFKKEFHPLGVSIIGGNISKGESLSVTITVIGRSDNKPLTRTGARVGDLICVTGTLGKAKEELDALMSGRKKKWTLLPPNRLSFAQKLAERQLATSCIDVSDGLSIDLHRLIKASNVGAEIQALARGPLANIDLTLYGGEEYELLFTIPKDRIDECKALSRIEKTPVSIIGEVVDRNNVTLIMKNGKRVLLKPKGWDHASPSTL